MDPCKKISNICWFKLLKYEDLLLVSVIYEESLVFIWIVGGTKEET